MHKNYCCCILGSFCVDKSLPLILVEVAVEDVKDDLMEVNEEPAEVVAEEVTEKNEEINDVNEEQEIMKKRELLMKGMLKGGGKKKPAKKIEKP